jgi:hypothetical protein
MKLSRGTVCRACRYFTSDQSAPLIARVLAESDCDIALWHDMVEKEVFLLVSTPSMGSP